MQRKLAVISWDIYWCSVTAWTASQHYAIKLVCKPKSHNSLWNSLPIPLREAECSMKEAYETIKKATEDLPTCSQKIRFVQAVHQRCVYVFCVCVCKCYKLAVATWTYTLQIVVIINRHIYTLHQQHSFFGFFSLNSLQFTLSFRTWHLLLCPSEHWHSLLCPSEHGVLYFVLQNNNNNGNL